MIDEVKNWLGKEVEVKMDRPLGSAHPNYPESIYPVNYGYLPGTLSEADKEEVDAYVLGPTEPLESFKGVVVGVIQRKDDELKLVVTDGTKYSAKEIKKLTYFQEQYWESEIAV